MQLNKKPRRFNRSKKKVYCANCSHCIVFRKSLLKKNLYVLRVRCNMGKWKRRSGEEKTYKYFTITRRIHTGCEFYDPMGEEKSFIKELNNQLPVKDEIYTL